mgnify:CR=1 FL=1
MSGGAFPFLSGDARRLSGFHAGKARRAADTYVLWEGENLVVCGMLDGAEVDLGAVQVEHQNRGLGGLWYPC